MCVVLLLYEGEKGRSSTLHWAIGANEAVAAFCAALRPSTKPARREDQRRTDRSASQSWAILTVPKHEPPETEQSCYYIRILVVVRRDHGPTCCHLQTTSLLATIISEFSEE
jgi:hypothetical protein